MDYRKIITLSLYNRPDYTFEVLNHLSKCYEVEDYTIIPFIDHDNHLGINQNILVQLLYDAVKQTKLKIDQPRLHNSNVGCNANIFTALNIGFQVTNYIIHLEDDIILAPDALQYFEWARKEYENDLAVFTIDTYNNTNHKVFPSAYEVERSQSFKPWGWATWIDRWKDIKDRWQFSFSPRYENGRQVFAGGGWDVCMKQYLRGDRYRVYPKLARCKNIGALNGAHTPSAEWHKAKHIDPVKWWAGDIKTEYYSDIKFNEVMSKGEVIYV